jgi:hypothetical protein
MKKGLHGRGMSSSPIGAALAPGHLVVQGAFSARDRPVVLSSSLAVVARASGQLPGKGLLLFGEEQR